MSSPAQNDAETWPNRREAAAELSTILGEDVSSRTLERWRAWPDCPIPSGRTPIPKAPLVRWALTERRAPGRPRASTGDAKEDQLRTELLTEQIRSLNLRNSVLAETTVGVDEARGAIVRAMGDFKRDLFEQAPGAAWAAITSMPKPAAIAAVTGMLNAALDRFAVSASDFRAGQTTIARERRP